MLATNIVPRSNQSVNPLLRQQAERAARPTPAPQPTKAGAQSPDFDTADIVAGFHQFAAIAQAPELDVDRRGYIRQRARHEPALQPWHDPQHHRDLAALFHPATTPDQQQRIPSALRSAVEHHVDAHSYLRRAGVPERPPRVMPQARPEQYWCAEGRIRAQSVLDGGVVYTVLACGRCRPCQDWVIQQHWSRFKSQQHDPQRVSAVLTWSRISAADIRRIRAQLAQLRTPTVSVTTYNGLVAYVTRLTRRRYQNLVRRYPDAVAQAASLTADGFFALLNEAPRTIYGVSMRRVSFVGGWRRARRLKPDPPDYLAHTPQSFAIPDGERVRPFTVKSSYYRRVWPLPYRTRLHTVVLDSLASVDFSKTNWPALWRALADDSNSNSTAWSLATDVAAEANYYGDPDLLIDAARAWYGWAPYQGPYSYVWHAIGLQNLPLPERAGEIYGDGSSVETTSLADHAAAVNDDPLWTTPSVVLNNDRVDDDLVADPEAPCETTWLINAALQQDDPSAAERLLQQALQTPCDCGASAHHEAWLDAGETLADAFALAAD